VKVLPCGTLPESKLLSTAVTVWTLESWFVQVTVVPALTVSGVGLKAKFLTVAALLATPAGAGPAEDVPPPHAASMAPAMMVGQTSRIMCRVKVMASRLAMLTFSQRGTPLPGRMDHRPGPPGGPPPAAGGGPGGMWGSCQLTSVRSLGEAAMSVLMKLSGTGYWPST
jgi:hypothetical protein